MESDQRRRRIKQLANMRAHLAELTVLCGRTVNERELLSLDRTEEVLSLRRQHPLGNKRSFEMNFSDLKSERFTRYIDKLSLASQGAVFLWIKHSLDCGSLELPSIANINFNFGFKDLPSALFSVWTTSFEDYVVFDFDENEDQQRIVEIGVEGVHWPLVEY